jgi:hypothetical protein
MISNRKAYDEAYQRAMAGHSPNLWQRVTAVFDDEYTRRSKAQGERDGAAARTAAETPTEAPVEPGAAAPPVEA